MLCCVVLCCAGILRGAFMLQNLPSLLAAHVLAPAPGARVLDMCAAPGGKTTAIAQLMEDRGEVSRGSRKKAGQQEKGWAGASAEHTWWRMMGHGAADAMVARVPVFSWLCCRSRQGGPAALPLLRCVARKCWGFAEH